MVQKDIVLGALLTVLAAFSIVAMLFVARNVTPTLDRARAQRAALNQSASNTLNLAAKLADQHGMSHWKGPIYMLDAAALAKLADDVTGGRSPVLLCENDQPLGPPHTDHDEIFALGGGRFSHFGNYVFFSTPDGSDPRINSRRYRVSLNGKCDEVSR